MYGSILGCGECEYRNVTRIDFGNEVRIKNSLQIKLWKFWQSYNYIELPDEFYEVSNYVGVANTDESSPNYARARGFVDGYNQNYFMVYFYR